MFLWPFDPADPTAPQYLIQDSSSYSELAANAHMEVCLPQDASCLEDVDVFLR